MATVTVRKLGDDVVSRLKERAARNNRSLEGEVREILGKAAGEAIALSEEEISESVRKFRENVRRLWASKSYVPQTPSEVLIREERDRGHKPWMGY